jgi:antitoxin ParD1/3/4
MDVSLTPYMESYIRRKIEAGHYRSASDVIRDALRLMEERDRHREAALAGLRGDTREEEVIDPVELFDRIKGAVRSDSNGIY